MPKGAATCPGCGVAVGAGHGEVTKPGAPPPGAKRLDEATVPLVRKPEGGRGAELSARDRIGGRFQVLRKLGQGGMGAVYACQDLELNRPVAIKRLLPKIGGKDWGVQRFLVEAKAVAAIAHQNVVQVYDITQEGADKYIVMEFVEGETLADRLEREGKLSGFEATRVMLQVGMGLQAAHERGVIHRDIKPGNIMLTTSGLAKIGDFGIAQVFGEADLTETGMAIGTWVYASPEQLVDAKRVDARSDVYSLGATLYEMLTGESPRNTNLEHVPVVFRGVVATCLARNPDERYQSVGDFVNGLARAHKEAQAKQADEGAEGAAGPAPGGDGAAAEAALRAARGRRRRSLWRARGVPCVAPVRLIVGTGLLVWLLVHSATGDRSVDRMMGGVIDGIEHQLHSARAQDGSPRHGDEDIALAILDGVRSVPFFWVGIVGGVWIAFAPVCRSLTTRFRLSTTRLSVTRGIVLRRERDFPLSEISEIRVVQGFLGSVLGYGSVELRLGYGDSVLLEGVPEPSALRQKIASAQAMEG